jgi:hypothetical protein
MPKSSMDRPHRDQLPDPPKSWRQALQHAHSTGFIEASYREWDTLQSKQTFDFVDENVYNQTLLPLMWVFTYKYNDKGYLVKYKARLCARGD